MKAESIFASGTGTKADPFVIKTEAQLRAFAASTTGDNAVDYAGQYVALDADITLNGAWTPIHYFAGNFDGRNHTVSGVRIGTELAPLEQKSVGFFDVLANGATLSNLNLTNVAVYGKITADYERPFVGGLVGGNLGMGKNARIDHCSVVGGIVSTEGKQWAYGGGLTASLYLDAYLTNSWTDVTVQVKSTEGLCSAGGLVATNSNGSMIANCAALGDVTAISGYTTSSKVSASVGGLVGQATGLFHNCYAAGNVALTMAITPDEPAVGSLIGQMSTGRSYNGIVTDCYYNSKATVSVNGTSGSATAIGDLVSGDTNNVAGVDTSSAAFVDTMNHGLTAEGLAATDKFLTSDDIDFTTDMLIAMRPAAWYGWEARDGKTVLGADVFVQPTRRCSTSSRAAPARRPTPGSSRTLTSSRRLRLRLPRRITPANTSSSARTSTSQAKPGRRSATWPTARRPSAAASTARATRSPTWPSAARPPRSVRSSACTSACSQRS